MIPAAFDYVRPGSLDEALAAIASGDGNIKVIAGGHSILPLMKLRLARPAKLVDIGRLAELKGIRPLSGGGLAVGSLTTYDELLADRRIMQLALLADAVPNIGDVQVRNRGTIGGGIAHADPASDMPAVLLALEADVVAVSARGERVIPMTGFLTGAFETVLAADELIREIRLPAPRGTYGSAYRAIEQPASGYSIAGAAVVVGREADAGPFTVCHVAVTGVGEFAYRASAVEAAFLAGATPAVAAAHATDGQTVGSDIHADREYRAAVAAVQVRRALETAIGRAG